MRINKLKIHFKDKILNIEEKDKISKILKKEIEKSEYTVIAAKFNNEYVNLDYEIQQDGKIELIDIATREGMKVYTRTLTYILGKVFEEIYPKEIKLHVDYQLSNSMFCDIENVEVTNEMIEKLQKGMEKW